MMEIYINEDQQITVSGLTQFDRGQVLRIYSSEFAGYITEAFFSVNSKENAIQMYVTHGDGYIETEVPNVLLNTGEDITCHIYITKEKYGKTVKTIYLQVKSRKPPDDFVDPDQQDILEKILEEIETKADNISYKDNFLQLLSDGKPIGDRVRIESSGGGGREIELRNNGTEIQWRYTDSNEWYTLAYLSDLQGPPGETPTFKIKDGHLYAIYQNQSSITGRR